MQQVPGNPLPEEVDPLPWGVRSSFGHAGLSHTSWKKPPTLAYGTLAHGRSCNGLDRYLLTRIVNKADRPPATPVISKPERFPSPHLPSPAGINYNPAGSPTGQTLEPMPRYCSCIPPHTQRHLHLNRPRVYLQPHRRTYKASLLIPRHGTIRQPFSRSSLPYRPIVPRSSALPTSPEPRHFPGDRRWQGSPIRPRSGCTHGRRAAPPN